MSVNDDSDEDEGPETMVITLGSRTMKAAYAGEKTCRYVSEAVHVLNSNDPTLVNPGENTLPLIDTARECINQKEALVRALRQCWTEQYTAKLDPSVTRFVLAVPTR